MSDGSSAWEKRVKEGLFQEERFTDEMKLKVLGAIERRPRRIAGLWPRLAGTVAACLAALLLVVYWPSGSVDTARPQGAAAGAEKAMTFQPLEARILTKGQTIYGSDPDILPGLSNKYSPLRNTGYVEQIPLTDIELIDKKEIPGFGTTLRYTLINNEDLPKSDKNGIIVYFGFVIEGLSKPGQLFHYGFGYLDGDDFSATRLFGQEVLKIDRQQCRIDGEACAFYVKKDEGGVSTFAEFDAATYERDLDGDGREEAIVATHKQNQIYIFKEEHGRLQWASVREALGAGNEDRLVYDEAAGLFEVYTPSAEQGDGVRIYAYTQDNKLAEVVQ
ncbi:hypothetical protein [Cohnella phaseoli]|uniref:Uncharacterized protein n=1 Tax=Cohnella phaseoli TaxID=456490 RepID=A0A3D9ICN5_9BACL|nr:hypothetical protein [Cohnella phaseoli]RED59415.1 hypothetical protein DFP98_1318 [Cohnella phaseoli]